MLIDSENTSVGFHVNSNKNKFFWAYLFGFEYTEYFSMLKYEEIHYHKQDVEDIIKHIKR